MQPPILAVTLPGRARPQGSMQLSRDPRTGKELSKYAQETVNHRNLVVGVLQQAWVGQAALVGPVAVWCRFTFTRPKSHFGTGRNVEVLKVGAPVFMSSMPDADKLLRLVNDALTIAGVIDDDKQIVVMRGEKVYGERAGTLVRVFDLGAA